MKGGKKGVVGAKSELLDVGSRMSDGGSCHLSFFAGR